MVWTATFPEICPPSHGCVLAIGNFDGVHDGHKTLLATARAEAVARALPLVVLTFEPHPRAVLFPHIPLKRLTDVNEKVARLAAAAADGVAVLPFDLLVAGWTPQRFLDDVVVAWLRAHCVCVGANFRFGHRAAGDEHVLRADGRFDTLIVELFCDEEGVVSSRRLRESVDKA